MRIKDYVQLRKSGERGEVVQTFKDEWVMVEFHFPAHRFSECHSNQLITLLKGDKHIG